MSVKNRTVSNSPDPHESIQKNLTEIIESPEVNHNLEIQPKLNSNLELTLTLIKKLPRF